MSGFNNLIIIIIVGFIIVGIISINRNNEEIPADQEDCKWIMKDIGGEEFECIECFTKYTNQYGITCDFSKPRG